MTYCSLCWNGADRLSVAGKTERDARSAMTGTVRKPCMGSPRAAVCLGHDGTRHFQNPSQPIGASMLPVTRPLTSPQDQARSVSGRRLFKPIQTSS